MATPDDRKYTKEHEWAKQDGDVVVVGITDHAQDSLGDVVYIDLPEVGTELEADDTFGEIESVKAVSDLYSPISGKVVAVNEALADTPELVNKDPYGKGWMVRIEAANISELDELLDADGYDELLEDEEG